ncbi:dihydrodipicolinate synthase/N-acetylneuraminate lyase [Deinobacterium chartae]|uniref:Dihydrodipicolinate synthase/N-acetylneuraminate lyase n=1 Tax=Deinobacterium chartae TaxID=521158 RepID=A0A841HXC4_9DEIO|nr:dihydrodipicolinate synthase family protein [Deinobacterium chartae]MBB6097503.1 dihydrodipicolinate synthase/N-acetylneuraminate lyase [Deinobacterium chartae]
MNIREYLRQGHVIPAHPLALDDEGRLEERYQRALTRYYLEAGAGGLAVGVHTTQFEIHDNGLLEPVLRLAAEEHARAGSGAALIAGAVGGTEQAVREARLARDLGYHAVLLSLRALRAASQAELIAHCRAVARELPLVGFYLQPAVGGQVLPYAFWREFFEIENVVAVKAAPFHRYWTLDVMRALADSGRAHEIVLYTGNDDHILLDLVLPTRFSQAGETLCFAGGLLGQWAVWTRRAVELLEEAKRWREEGAVPHSFLLQAQQLTDANAAVFDVAGEFRGCIAGIQYVLWRQGLLPSMRCVSDHEVLSPGQQQEIERVRAAYPHLTDDAFVAANLGRWLDRVPV